MDVRDRPDSIFWPLFLLAGMFFAATGFPARMGAIASIDLSGVRFLAQALMLFGFVGIAIALKVARIDLRTAIGLSIACLLVTCAVGEGSARAVQWILPLPVVALIVWPRGEAPTAGFMPHLPPVIRQAIALVLAVMGASMLSSGVDYFRVANLRFDYFEIWVGSVMYASAVVMLVVGLNKTGFTRIAISGYVACLLLFALSVSVEWGKTPFFNAKAFSQMLVVAMLLFQAWRHFFRKNGWLKLIETLIGGVIVALALASFLEWYRSNDAWMIVGLPIALLALALCAIGMVLIWSDAIWLKRFALFRPPADR